jgi:glycosyltransferase involved in cell wall biosynthesis
MHVAIDAAIAHPRSGGVGNYAMRIIDGLAHTEGVRVTALVPEESVGEVVLPEQSPKFRFTTVPVPADAPSERFARREYWEQRLLPEHVDAVGPDIFFGPLSMGPINWPGIKVVTVHDLAFEHFTGHNAQCPPAYYSYYSRWARKCASDASALLCVSHDTRADVEERWGILGKSHVTHIAPCLDFVPADHASSVRLIQETFSLREPFCLYVGGAFPRKNVARLIEAAYLCPDITEKFPLVLALEDSDELSGLIREYQLERCVRLIGHCPSRLLPHLYRAAQLVVYPSLSEGFGLPPLEALSCGTAVAATKAGAVPEILQDNAVYFEPRVPESIAAALSRLIQDRGLRHRLGRDGKAFAASYTWERTTAATAAVLGSFLP